MKMPNDDTAMSAEEVGEKYFLGKIPGRTYMSKRIVSEYPDGTKKNIRIVSKVMDGKEEWMEAQLKKEIVLRVTPGGRQEVVAKFYEDNRGIFVLTIQRYRRSADGSKPIQEHFSFIGEEIGTLKEFIDSIQYFPISSDGKARADDVQLKQDIERVRAVLSENPDLDVLIEMAQSKITKADVVTLAYRKKQLEVFQQLLQNENADEADWQRFFEQNVWIFGYGLNYVFNAPLEGKKLEQVVQGSDVGHSGKRADGLLKTRGIISSLCLVEIKKPQTPLLKQVKLAYRTDCWQVADDMNGAIAQSQKTAQKTIENLRERLETYNENGDPTGESIFSYKPKSYLIIGNLQEFETPEGVNKEKYASFELYRKNMLAPEVITFDELYERAKFIVQNNEENRVQTS